MFAKKLLSIALALLLILGMAPAGGLAAEANTRAPAPAAAAVDLKEEASEPAPSAQAPAEAAADAEPPAEARAETPTEAGSAETRDGLCGAPDEDRAGLGGEAEEPLFNTWISDAAETEPSKRAIPASYNAADEGIVTSVKDQGSYGTCWAMASLSCVETYMIKYGVINAETNRPADRTIDLSEYHLNWFTYTDAYDKLGLLDGDSTVPILDDESPSFLDVGGNATKAGLTMLRGEGPASEQVVGLAYSDADPAGLASTHAYSHNVAQVTDLDEIPSQNRSTVKQKILEHGSGTIGIHYSSKYMNRNNGAYALIQTVSPGDDNYLGSNHHVTIVGWDDNYPRTNFLAANRPKQNGAWIIKNSHGTDSGDDGYLYLSYEDTVALNSTCRFFRVVEADIYDSIYQYDGTLCTKYQYSEEPDLWVANTFDMVTNELLSAAAVMTEGEGVSYTLELYSDPTDETNPRTGTLLRIVSGTFDYSGYHTVTFDPVLVRQGQTVAVVFHLNCPTAENGEYVRVNFDADSETINCNNYHATRSGRSLFLGTNGKWYKKTTGNYRIKLFTKNTEVVVREETWDLLQYKVEQIVLSGLFTSGRTVVSFDVIGGALPQGMRLLWEENAMRVIGAPSTPGTYTVSYCIKLSDSTVVEYTLNLMVHINNDSVTAELALLPYLQETERQLHAQWGSGGIIETVQFSGSTPAGLDVRTEGLDVPVLYGVPFKTGTYNTEIRYRFADGTYIDHMLHGQVFNASRPIETLVIDLSRGSLWIDAADFNGWVLPTLRLMKQDGGLSMAEGSGGSFSLDLNRDWRYDILFEPKNGAYCAKMYSDQTLRRDYSVSLTEAMLGTLGSRTDYAKTINFFIEPHMIPSFTFDLSDGKTHSYLRDEFNAFALLSLNLLQRDGMLDFEARDSYGYLDLDLDGNSDVWFWIEDEYVYFQVYPTTSVVYREFTLTDQQKQELSNTNSACKLRFCLPKPSVCYDLWVCGVQVTDLNMGDILGNGVFDFNGVTLSIHGDCAGRGILVHSKIDGLLIYTASDSTLTSENHDIGLDLNRDATLWGPGKLTLENCNVGVYLDGADVRLRLHYTELEASGRWGVAGENRNETLIVDDASILADGTSGAVCDIHTILLRNAKLIQPTGGRIQDDDVVNPDGSLATHAEILSSRKYNPFSDVKEGSYYYDAVLWAANREPPVTTGTDDTHFHPGRDCTRAQVVTFLWRAKGMPTPYSTACAFVDVKSTAYYYTAMLWAVEAGITKGKDSTHFGPNLDCTRAEVVTFLWRAAGEPEPKSAICPFKDVKTTAYYYKAVLWAVEKNITAGTSSTAFSPGKTCTRGQVVTFLYRAYGPKG